METEFWVILVGFRQGNRNEKTLQTTNWRKTLQKHANTLQKTRDKDWLACQQTGPHVQHHLAPVTDPKKHAVWAATPREAGWIADLPIENGDVPYVAVYQRVNGGEPLTPVKQQVHWDLLC